MTEQTTVSPAPAAQAVQPVQVPAAQQSSSPSTVPAEKQQPATSEPATPQRKPWFIERIDQLTAGKSSAERRADQLIRENEALKANRQAPAPNGHQPSPLQTQTQRPPTQDEIDRLVDQRASQRIATDRFNEASNEVYEKGKGAYTDFDEALGNLRSFDGVREFLVDAVQLKDAHAVIYALGKNPDEASRILSLPAFQQAIAVKDLSEKLAKNPKAAISNAPAPITPIDSTSKPSRDLYDAGQTTAEWMAQRKAARARK